MTFFAANSALFAHQWPAERASEHLARHLSAQIFAGGAFGDWVVFSSPILDDAVTAFGAPVFTGRAFDELGALELVQTATRNQSTFERLQSWTAGRLYRSHFREIVTGLPVLSGRADFTFNADGLLMRWSLCSYGSWPLADQHLLDLNTAASALTRGLPDCQWEVDRTGSIAAWFPDFNSRQLLPVYWVRVVGPEPTDRWEGIVSAISGEVLMDWPGIQTDQISLTMRGTYWQPYQDSDPQIGVHPFETVRVNDDTVITNRQGRFTAEVGSTAHLTAALHGPYVAVANDDAPNSLLDSVFHAPYSPSNWIWTTEHAVPGELNLYYHTMFVHEWYKDLDQGFTALDYPLPAVCNVGNAYDNAFWNGYGTYYGSGMLYHDFALFSDVIYHEYTHGVTDGIYPDHMLPYIGQPGALNEAWSDYIACSINNDHLMGERMQIGNPNAVFRNLINNMVFPRDWRGEVHADSPFISGALWRIRLVMGPGFTDSLAHYARYALAETFIDYLLAVLETDDDDGNLVNGTPHDRLIYQSFGYHGVGPGSDPHFALRNVTLRADGEQGTVGDGDRYVEQGETAALVFDLANVAELYPPAPEDVQILVTSLDPYITVLNGQQSAGEIPAGSAFTVTPVMLQVAASCANHWATLIVGVTANQGSFSWSDTIKLTIGSPKLLIVDDDPNTPYESYVLNALRSRGRIYDRVALGTGENLSADRLLPDGLLLWLSGDASGEILTAADRQLVIQYLNNGGKVVLTGQNIVDNLNGSDFARNVLQVSIFADSLPSRSVTAVRAPLVPGELFVTVGSEGANNQREPSAFLTSGSSYPVACYGRSDTGAIAVVAFSNGNGLLFGFGIEAISGMVPGSQSLATLLDELAMWVGELSGVCPPSSELLSPAEYTLGAAYPNPFNSTTIIPFALPQGTRGRIEVFDVLGRVVESRSLPHSSGTYVWTPALATGVYFITLQWDGGRTAPQKVMLIR